MKGSNYLQKYFFGAMSAYSGQVYIFIYFVFAIANLA